MTVLPTRFWAEMGWRDFAAADMENVVVVLPVAAIEQHGPHLPVGVDTFIAEGYIQRTLARLPADLPALFLPVQTIGKSDEHIEYPGTLTLSAETLMRVWNEVGDSLARAGCRRLVVMNSHGGNVPVIDIVIRDLRLKHSMLAVHAAWHRLGYPDGAFPAEEIAHGIHGGDAETSLMLAFRPDTVKRQEAGAFESLGSRMERDFKHLRATGRIGFAWMASDLHETGAVGDAARASAERGDALADFGAERFVELLRDVLAFDLSLLKPGPLVEKAP